MLDIARDFAHKVVALHGLQPASLMPPMYGLMWFRTSKS
jgi:hypothetical protein